jgi:hypothetical protein
MTTFTRLFYTKRGQLMWFKCLIIAVLIFFTASCSDQPKRRTIPKPTEVAKVRVESVDGRVYVNESVVTLDELKEELGRLKQIHRAVWFIDESSFGASRMQGQTVRKAIIAAQLPIRVR